MGLCRSGAIDIIWMSVMRKAPSCVYPPASLPSIRIKNISNIPHNSAATAVSSRLTPCSRLGICTIYYIVFHLTATASTGYVRTCKDFFHFVSHGYPAPMNLGLDGYEDGNQDASHEHLAPTNHFGCKTHTSCLALQLPLCCACTLHQEVLQSFSVGNGSLQSTVSN